MQQGWNKSHVKDREIKLFCLFKSDSPVEPADRDLPEGRLQSIPTRNRHRDDKLVPNKLGAALLMVEVISLTFSQNGKCVFLLVEHKCGLQRRRVRGQLACYFLCSWDIIPP